MNKTLQDNRFFKTILSSIADGVFTVDGDRVITSFNSAAERITGVPAARAIGRKCYEVFHSDICETGCLLEKTMHSGQEVIDVPVRILNSSGRRIPISISTSVLRDEDGRVLGAAETFRDLSAIESLRKQIEQSYSFEDIITKSPALLKVLAFLPDVAESDSSVLIQGDSGTGKELLARAVHNLSQRRDKPYAVINCGTLPSQLFESEMFGYVKGAFTDAKRDKLGKIAAADGGTVFLDEVAELPPQFQVKLLRLLQQKEYEPVGSVKVQKADVRFVAATNQDLRRLVDLKKFREDLYFRLAVVKLELPTLRERREDIPYLVDHFIRLFNARKGKRIVGVSPGVMSLLMQYEFPGNIRELENIIEYGFAVCHGRTIEIEHIPAEVLQTAKNTSPSPGITRPQLKSLPEDDLIRELLRQNHGNRNKTAETLGMHRTTLWRKLKKLNLISTTS